jgi:hypothetical protein
MIIYLAAPYSHREIAVRRTRFFAATRAAAALIDRGHIILSPLIMTHPIDQILYKDGHELNTGYWIRFDEAFMSNCAELWILTLEGWKKSKGIRREIEYFEKRGRPVIYLDHKSLEPVTHFQ